ncbi:HBR193Wp [Eremothecium sinecaudum]|uniref:HBR193Wp n=1 Tax=Eremothecium sinecaudum TaxID=45286 RepID=A0A120K176_9SACH|nr:HBR193Wp [Eremothecium sinecaudum]AMD19094.1 HBR193Wp [Eremothecium sinecaudum]
MTSDIYVKPPSTLKTFTRSDRVPAILTVAGSDPSGGAGIEADVKTITAHGCYAMTCISALTNQTPRAVQSVQHIDGAFIAQILNGLFTDMRIDVVKTGMLTDVAVEELMHAIQTHNFKGHMVVDPVMVASSNAELADYTKIRAASALYGRATLVTPNIVEAFKLLGDEPTPLASVENMKDLARRLKSKILVKNLLLKGGHVRWPRDDGSYYVTDILLCESGEILVYTSDYIETKHTHGTGCTLASAIAANLSIGYSLKDSVHRSIEYVQHCIKLQPKISPTFYSENGPINHCYELYSPIGVKSLSDVQCNVLADSAITRPKYKTLEDLLQDPLIKPHWESYIHHDFVNRIVSNTLPADRFYYFLSQDKAYLLSYSQIVAVAFSKAPTIQDMQDHLFTIKEVLDELNQHGLKMRTLFPEKENEPPIQRNNAFHQYIGYLRDIAKYGTWEQICVSLMPCLFGYGFAAQYFSTPEKLVVPKKSCYYLWIQSYISDEYQAGIDTGRKLLERILSETQNHDVYVRIFADICKLEAQFFEACM